jgi:hypothetical protein
MKNGVRSRWSSGLGVRKFAIGGSWQWCRQRIALMKPATPAAESR